MITWRIFLIVCFPLRRFPRGARSCWLPNPGRLEINATPLCPIFSHIAAPTPRTPRAADSCRIGKHFSARTHRTNKSNRGRRTCAHDKKMTFPRQRIDGRRKGSICGPLCSIFFECRGRGGQWPNAPKTWALWQCERMVPKWAYLWVNSCISRLRTAPMCANQQLLWKAPSRSGPHRRETTNTFKGANCGCFGQCWWNGDTCDAGCAWKEWPPYAFPSICKSTGDGRQCTWGFSASSFLS